MKSIFMHFYFFDPAFSALGRILRQAPREVHNQLFFTIGLASIVLISKDDKIAGTVEQAAGVAPRAKETWKIKNSRIVSIKVRRNPTKIKPFTLKLGPYGTLPLAARAVVHEFVSSMAVILPKAAVHVPNEVKTFSQLVSRVSELVNEMVYVSSPQGRPPRTLSEYKAADLRSNDSVRRAILNQNIDRMVQINSALSYVSTQALTGAVPILERRSLIRRYSLLGVGTAVLSLTRLARSIERAFAQGALETFFSDRAQEAPSLPGLDSLPDYDPSDWPDHSVNRWSEKLRPRDSYPKLPYFSGRLGFREAEYTISAALQALPAGASPEWSLLTITHEMVHGHVRNQCRPPVSVSVR